MAEQQIVAEEELRAANEELQSSNEELRSTLEEIETGKEELQSINEELETVNEENRHKVEELSRLSSDLQNLLVATDIATLFLDRQLRIMRFTPRVADLFSIRAADRGRPLSDITQALDYDRLQQDAQEVLKHLTPVEREVRDQDGNWYLARVLPYRSHDDRIEGVVLTFVDITRRRLAEQRYRTLFESIDEGFCIIEMLFDDQDEPFDYRFIEVNPAFESQTGLRDAAGRTMRELAPQHEEHWYRRYGRIARSGEPERFEDHAEQLEDRWFDVYAFPIGDPNECRVAALFRDVTARRRAEQALRALTDELERRVVERTREVRQLSDTLALTEQQERARLSQVLHDDLQQLLYGIQMQVAMARDQAVDAGMDGLVAATRRAMDHLDDAINRTRQLTVDLSPPILEDEGLADAIEWLRPRMLDLHGLELDIRQERDIEVTSAMRVLAFQVVRELVFNVAKHAEVDVVQVVIDGDDGVVRVSVEDDGVGFDVDALHDDPDSRSGLGLRSARERLRLGGARLEIESSPGEGTRALLLLPAAGAATDTDSDPDADADADRS
jgi:two-component system CheB/CheR fusion protein